MEHSDEPNELTDAPFLRSVAKSDPFVVPEGFFDRFPHTVQQQALSGNRGSERSVPGWQRLLRPALAIASIALVATAALLWMERPEATPAPVAEDTHWSESDLLHADMDVELLYTEFHPEADLMDVVHLPKDDDAVLAYLDNEDLPLDLLIEEL